MSPLRLPKRNRFFTLRRPEYVDRPAALAAFIVAVALYFVVVLAAATQIYKEDKSTRFTNNAASLFPFPASFVNGDVITWNRFEREITARWYYAEHHTKDPKRDEVERFVADQLIDRTLFRQELMKRQLIVTETDIAEQLDRVEQEIGGEAKLLEFLHDQYGPGVTLDQFRQWIRDSLYEAAIKQKVLTHAEVSHLLIAVPEDAAADKVEAARKKAEEVRAGIADPAKFAEAVKEYSDDIATRDKGGRLGETGHDGISEQFSNEFENAIFTLPVGQVSQPIRTRYGWHLVVVNRRDGEVNLGLADYTAALRKDARIVKFVGK